MSFNWNHQEQITGIRRQLEGMFNELRLVQDVIIVCGGASDSVRSELDVEIEHVLRRCGSDRLFNVLQTLTAVVELFGGRTEMSEEQREIDR